MTDISRLPGPSPTSGSGSSRAPPRQGHGAVLPPGGRARPPAGRTARRRPRPSAHLPGLLQCRATLPRRPRAVRRLGRAVRARARGHHRLGRESWLPTACSCTRRRVLDRAPGHAAGGASAVARSRTVAATVPRPSRAPGSGRPRAPPARPAPPRSALPAPAPRSLVLSGCTAGSAPPTRAAGHLQPGTPSTSPVARGHRRAARPAAARRAGRAARPRAGRRRARRGARSAAPTVRERLTALSDPGGTRCSAPGTRARGDREVGRSASTPSTFRAFTAEGTAESDPSGRPSPAARPS
jgi:hypothetical protein